MEYNTLQWNNATTIVTRNKGRDFYFYYKRFIDVILATFLLILLLPFMLLIAILIKLDSRGPIFFTQERVGAKRRSKDGQAQWETVSFEMFKFRTMRVDTGDDLHRQFMAAYIAGNEAKMAELQPDPAAATAFKLAKDPRVTRVGKFLRVTSLDELPQLWNVIVGDMSLVGPRPPIPYEVEMYNPEHFQRLATTPGITGLWQVSGRCEIGFNEMVNLDLEYIEKQSLWFDFKILFGTISAVVSKKGAE